MTEAEKRKAEAIDIDSDLFDEEIEEEEPDKETPPTEIIEVKATEVDSTKLEDKKDEWYWDVTGIQRDGGSVRQRDSGI